MPSQQDRRERERCPVCQGPAVADPKAPEGIRCRKSICTHNHAAVVCPRCGVKDLESVNYFPSGEYEFICRDCTHKWRVAPAPA